MSVATTDALGRPHRSVHRWGITTHRTIMNKNELKKYVEGLADDTEIIIVNTKEQASVIPKHCERVDVGGKIVLLYRKIKAGIWVVAVAWVLQSVELLPKPEAVFLAAKEKIEYVVKHTDWSFPYTDHDSQYPPVAFEFNGSIHYLPTSSLSLETLAQTGSFSVNTKA